MTIPERRDSYRSFIKILGGRVVTEFNYRYGGANDTHVLVGLKLDDAHREKAGIIDEFLRSGYEMLDMSADETAKLHVRYMVGGRAEPFRTKFSFDLNFRSAPALCCDFSTRSAIPGTSRCFTTAMMARITAACWPDFRCPQTIGSACLSDWTRSVTSTKTKRAIRLTGSFEAERVPKRACRDARRHSPRNLLKLQSRRPADTIGVMRHHAWQAAPSRA